MKNKKAKKETKSCFHCKKEFTVDKLSEEAVLDGSRTLYLNLCINCRDLYRR